MTSRSRRALLLCLLAMLYLTLVVKIGWTLYALSSEKPLPGSVAMTSESLGERTRLTLTSDTTIVPPVSAVLLPLGPDEYGLPGSHHVWQEMARATQRDSESGVRHGFDGLQLVDMPSRYERRTHAHVELAHQIVDMQRTGNHAYLLNGEGEVLTLDLADPGSPAVVGILPLPAPAKSMTLFRGALYLLTRLSHAHAPELVVMDISQPSRPREINRQRLPFDAEVLHVFNGFLGVHGGGSGRADDSLRLYDFDEDHTLVLQSRVEGIWADQTQLTDGDYWYVARLRGGLSVYHIADPASPLEVGRLEMPERFKHLARLGDRLFAWGTLGNLYIIDISDPTIPALMSVENDGSFLLEVAFIKGYTYLFGRNGGLHIFDQLPKSGTIRPGPLVSADLLLPHSGRSGFLPIGEEGGKERVPVPGISRLRDPLAPAEKAVAAAWWRGRLLLLTAGRLRLFSVSDQGSPALESELQLPPGIRWLTASADQIYLGGEGRLLAVHSAPDAGLQLSRDIPLPQAETWAAVIADANLLVAAGDQGLLRFGLEDPDRPKRLPAWTLPKQIAGLVDLRRVAVDGNRIYAAAGAAGLIYGRLTGPGDLALEGQVALEGPVRDLLLAGGLCLAATPGSVQVIDVRQSQALQKIGAIGFAGVQQLVLAAPDFWAGRRPGKGWVVLPWPRLFRPEQVAEKKLIIDLAGLPDATLYHLNLYNPAGVTGVPGVLRLAELSPENLAGGGARDHF